MSHHKGQQKKAIVNGEPGVLHNWLHNQKPTIVNRLGCKGYYTKRRFKFEACKGMPSYLINDAHDLTKNAFNVCQTYQTRMAR